MPAAPDRPTLVYDGHCPFCRRWVERWRFLTGERIAYRAYQNAADDFPQVPREHFGQAVHLIEPDGRVTRGAEAVFRSLAMAGRKRWAYFAYRHVPGFAGIAEAGYAFVARHREPLDKLDGWLIGDTPVAYRLTRRYFLVGLAIVYVCAFASLYVQVDGLIGTHGILPAADYMRAIREAVDARGIGSQRFLLVPTLCWFGASDTFLHALCLAGMAAGVLLAIGLWPGGMCVACWICYLSLASVCQDFLGFQWDSLLLDAGFLAIFLAPWRPWPRLRDEPPPSAVMIFLCRWLAFRLMFLSGVVKVASGDVTWRSWEALRYHYETQPLPPWTAWYMHQLPGWFQKASVGFVFWVELVVPFLMFGPRRVRVLAFWFTIVFQLIIAATGNFGFFNWLAVVLCVPLLDDALLPWGRRFLAPQVEPRRTRVPVGPWLKGAVAALLLTLSVPQVLAALEREPTLPTPLLPLYRWTESLHLTSPYGLFAVMTTRRPEVLVEWSDDGVTWTPYAFKYKPGDPARRPPFCQPHMPRLDWMMWFAALGPADQSPWFANFAASLLEARPEVLALLDHPPREKPKYVRATLYEYHFTTRAERARTGHWWKREEVGPWFPAVSGADLVR